VQLAGFGRTVVGGDRDPAWARVIAEAFSEAGLDAGVRKDISRELWSKVVVSACINPLTAALRVPNGTLLVNPTICRLVSEVAKECVRVAAAEGQELSERQSIAYVRRVTKHTSRNHSSMLQDIERGRRTEISMINGAICRYAAKRGIPVPLNSTLVAIVESLERTTASEKG
ncbi:MAG TPA: 2-dehydropantoate 2-reductase, partial [Thermoplasmata archaeon]|nr:2-dehydropantoate 2-reductase [Thermoplasmata archaeon]